MHYIFALILTCNIFTFFIFGLDKRKAIKNKWRIKESTLLLCALLMGSFGALLGMKIFHHKTKHAKFKILVPIFAILNIVLIAMLYTIFLY